MKRWFLAALALLLLVIVPKDTIHAAGEKSMVSNYLGWEYGKTGTRLNGYIPALGKNTSRPWELYRWNGYFSYESNGSTVIMPNYDVFNIKKQYKDDDYDRENGFGLVYASKGAITDFMEVVYKPVKVSVTQKQWSYFVDKATDYILNTNIKPGHEYFYKVNNMNFLRVAGISPRMGVKFNRTQKVSATDHRAYFDVSPWPKLDVSKSGTKLIINYEASGYSPREIKVSIVPSGGWIGEGKEMKVTAFNTSLSGTYKPGTPLEVESNQVAYQLNVEKDAKVDVILDDGYGRTAVVHTQLTDTTKEKIDFMATDLFLEGDTIYMKFKYWGDRLSKEDLAQLVHANGVPMRLKITADKVSTLNVDNDTIRWNVRSKYPNGINSGDVFTHPLGKVNVKNGEKVTLKVTGTVDDPKSHIYVQEVPAGSAQNNSITKTFVLGGGGDLASYSVNVTPNPILEGSTATVTGKAINKGTTAQNNVLIRFYLDDRQVYETRKNMPVQQLVTTKFTLPFNTVGNYNLKMVVDPNNEHEDRDRSNNMKYTGVTCEDAGGGSGGCVKKATGTWDADYVVITGYRTKYRTVGYTDYLGKYRTYTESYTDYNDPIYATRTVSYTERLTTNVTANTKQGIATDRDNPKESDRESRGSWEIIPYASERGLDPNLITRAGYGFELKVNMNYFTDWEKKIPSTARAFGGTYSGPQDVYALVYDTKGRLAKRVKLEKTGATTWEVPMSRYQFSTGEVIYERKIYTDETWPDGAFTVRISASAPNSRTGLSVCEPITLYIFGSMYDDIQHVLQPKS